MGCFLQVDMKSPEIESILSKRGKKYRRRIEPVRGVREPLVEEQVDTIVNGIVESSTVARPGEHKIITGSRGEEFVFTNAKFDSMYSIDDEGNVIPRERFVLAMRNPCGGPVSAVAPWSTPDNPQSISGTARAMMVFGLDESGQLTDDRYFIGDMRMLLANYEPTGR